MYLLVNIYDLIRGIFHKLDIQVTKAVLNLI